MAVKSWSLSTPADDALKNTVPGLIRDVKEHAFTASGFYAEQQSTPDDTIAIYAGVVYFGITKVEYAGLNIVDLGTGGGFETTALTASYYNKVLFTINSSGTLEATEGTEHAVLASVVEPAIPAGKFPICMVSVQDDGTATAGTILTIEQSEIKQLQGVNAIAKTIATDTIWAAAGDLVQGTGNDTAAVLPLGVASLGVVNLKPVVNGTVNKLDIFTKSGGAVPDATDYFTVAIPDGNGYTARTRKAAYLSGTSQFILADATDYWSKGALAAEIKTAYVYAIWDAAGGIVWALGGYSGFTRVPASTTVGNDDFFLLEEGSTYTKVITDYCVCVAKVRYEYDTGDAPDHTFQATALDAPQVMWNPKSDYGYKKSLTTGITSGSNIAEYSACEVVIKQSGKYFINGNVVGTCATTPVMGGHIKTGSSTYGSATNRAYFATGENSDQVITLSANIIVNLNVGDSIHLGAYVAGGSGDRTLYGDSNQVGSTVLSFMRID
jgi:hypothetical protein